jgi:hypothetical protein
LLGAISARDIIESRGCYENAECRWVTKQGGKSYKFDFHALCDKHEDYTFTDHAGHRYYAEICGEAGAKCLPKDWNEYYEFGVAVQLWDQPPTCPKNDADKTCFDKNAGRTPACCTAPCEVLGTGAPTFSLLDKSNPNTGGVRATFTSVAEASDDPTACRQRTIHYNFLCDKKVTGRPKTFQFTPNATDGCDYILEFKTAHACANYHTLSGGAIFAIILFVGIALYIGVGMTVTYVTEHIIAFPNRHFWMGLVDRARALVGGGSSKPATPAYEDVDAGGAYQSTAPSQA